MAKMTQQEWFNANPQYANVMREMGTKPMGAQLVQQYGNSLYGEYDKYAKNYDTYEPLKAEAQKAYGTDNINNIYKMLSGYLSQRQGQAAGSARQSAASQSAGLLNPQAFISNQGQQAQAPYAQAFGQLAGQQGQAIQNANNALYQALFNISRAQTGDELAQQQLALQKQQMQYAQDANTPSVLDYLMPLLGAATSNPYLMFPSLLNKTTGNP